MEKLKVNDFIITDEYDVVSAEEALKEVIKKLLEMKKGVLLVKNEEKVLGVITERKILRKLLEKEKINLLKASEVMDTKIMFIKYDMELDEAIKEIKRQKPSAVIVNDEKDDFKGYFSPLDFIEAEKKLQEVREGRL
ncbi:MAG: CBS domain-containing protein [Candidatus Thermoplasmatota archaeon]